MYWPIAFDTGILCCTILTIVFEHSQKFSIYIYIRYTKYFEISLDTWYYKKEEVNIIAIISTIILY